MGDASCNLLSNGLCCTYLRDQMPLDHWFHAFQVTFGDLVVSGPDIVTQALTTPAAYDYSTALSLYAECFVRPLDHGPRGHEIRCA